MILSFLSEVEQQEVLPLLQEVFLKKGQLLFGPEDETDGLFFLKEGQVGVRTKTGFEDKQQVVALLDPDAPVGERGIADGKKRGMTVIAIEDTVLLLLTSTDFLQIEVSSPAIAIKILKRMLKISSIRLKECSERLAHVL